MAGSVGHIYLDVKLQTKYVEDQLRGIAQQWQQIQSGMGAGGGATAQVQATTRAVEAQAAAHQSAGKAAQASANAQISSQKQLDAALRAQAKLVAGIDAERSRAQAAANAARAQDNKATIESVIASAKARQQASQMSMRQLEKEIRATGAAATQQATDARRGADAAIKAAQQVTASTKAEADKQVAIGKRKVEQIVRQEQAAAKASTSLGGALGAGSQELFVGLGAARSGNIFYGLAAGSRYIKNVTAALGEMSVASKVAVGAAAGVGLAVAGIGVAAAAASVKIARFGLEQAASLEMLNIQLTGLLGSAEKGAQEMEFLLNLGKESIVPTKSLIEADRLMLAFGVTTDSTRRQLVNFMSDFGTATGASEQQVYFLSLALGQVASFGKANSVDMRQLANAGINTMQVYEIVGKKIGMTAQEVAAGVSDGLLTADLLFEALNEYGTGFEATADMARKSTLGLLSNIRDIVTTNIGLAFQQANAGVSQFLQSFMSVVESIDFTPLANAVRDALAMITGAFGGGEAAGNTLKDLFQTTLPAAIRVFGGAVAAVVAPLALVTRTVIAVVNGITSLVRKIIEVKPLLAAVTIAVGLFTAGLIAQNAQMIAVNAQAAVYILRLGAVNVAQVTAAGSAKVFAGALATVRAGVGAVLGPIGLLITALIAAAAEIKNAYDAGQALADGNKTVTETMNEQTGITGFLALGFANLQKMMGLAGDEAAEAEPKYEGQRGAISGTVQAAIDAGNAIRALSGEVRAAAAEAWYATQSYYALWQAIANAARARWEYNNTSGTVSSAIAAGLLAGPDGQAINRYNQRFPAPPTGGSTGGGGSSSGSSGPSAAEQAAIARAEAFIERYKQLYADANAARKKFVELVKQPFGEPSEIQTALTSGNVGTIIGMNDTLREQIMTFYRALIKSTALGTDAVKEARRRRNVALAQLDDDTRKLITLAKRQAQILDEDLPRIEKIYDEQSQAIQKSLDGLETWRSTRESEINQMYDDLLASANTALDAATARYEEANGKLQDLISERDQFLNSVQDSLRSFVNGLNTVETEIQKYTRLDAVGSFLIENIKQTASFKDTLAQRLQALRDWTANVRSLMARGLDADLIQQFVAAGVEGSGDVVNQLAGADDATIAGINQIQSELMAEVDAFKSEASAAWFDAGIAQQEAYVAPLRDAMNAAASYVTSLESQRKMALDALKASYDEQKQMYDKQLADLTANYEKQKDELAKELELIETAMTNTANQVNQQFAGLAVSTAAQGVNVMDGFIMGMNSKEEAAVNNAKRIAKRLNEAFAGVLGIASPSKVTTYFGQMIGQGLVVGMNSMSSKVGVASTRLALRALPAPSLRSVGLPTAAGVTGTSIGGMALDAGAPGGIAVKVFIGDRELTDIVDYRIEAADARSLDYVSSGRRI